MEGAGTSVVGVALRQGRRGRQTQGEPSLGRRGGGDIRSGRVLEAGKAGPVLRRVSPSVGQAVPGSEAGPTGVGGSPPPGKAGLRSPAGHLGPAPAGGGLKLPSLWRSLRDGRPREAGSGRA